MIIPNDQHVKFYEWQIQLLEEEWERYANANMKILIMEKRLFVGRIWGIVESNGCVVLRFKSGSVPRMKQPYILCLVDKDCPVNTSEWNFTYLNFRQSIDPRLSGKNTEINTINYLKTEDEQWSFILVSGFEEELISVIKEKFLDKKLHPVIVVAETDPPIDYLIKLKEFVRLNFNDNILNLNVSTKEEDWHPHLLNNKINVTQHVIDIIGRQNYNIIQGPPGTGKSYLAAELCEHYIKEGKSVCVTALTNKALVEIADKSGLSQSLKDGKVYKTNLSSDELKQIPNLKRVKKFSPIMGELLLSTYFKLAQKQAELFSSGKRFDLIIIEEASQAYLATIAMFISIAAKILIIGDHKQLTPVVIKKDDAKQINGQIDGIINGLRTFAFNNNSISYRLIYTRRLTSDASMLTGLFYDNNLKSISDIEGNTKFNSKHINLFHSNGGISIAKLPSSMNGFTEQKLIKLICLIAEEIILENTELDLALLSPYINIESKFYEQFSKLSSDYRRITISTVHKIQGLTSDLTILYLPLNNPAFDLDANLFNVSTSRAKRGTLIVTYNHIDLLKSGSNETNYFINHCKDVSEDFKKILFSS